MGNKQSAANHIDITDINTNYVFESKFTDTRFGEIKCLKKRDSSQRIFQKDFSTNSAEEFEQYIKKVKDRLPLLHPNLIKVLGYNSKKEDLLCADFFKVSLFFEGFETDLEKEIQKRSQNKNYYTEAELRNMLDSLIAVCAYLERNGVFLLVYKRNSKFSSRLLTGISDLTTFLSLKTENICSVITASSLLLTVLPILESLTVLKQKHIIQALKSLRTIVQALENLLNSISTRMTSMAWDYPFFLLLNFKRLTISMTITRKLSSKMLLKAL